MARKVAWVPILVVALAVGCRQRELPLEAVQAVDQWLGQNCAVGQDGKLEEKLRQYGSRLEDLFLTAFLKGPPQQKLDAVAAEALEQWQRVQSLVMTDSVKERLDYKQAEAILAISAQSQVDRIRNSYIRSYSSAALTGLWVVGGRKGRQILQREAADPRSPFQEVAEDLLLLKRR